MSLIRDSRTLYGPQPHETAQEIQDHWTRFGLERGWWNPVTGVRTPGGTVTVSNTTLPAYVSDSRWVADCPCGGGIGCWPQMGRGCCYDCGTSYQISFPATRTRGDAEEVLANRPEPGQRNWRPDRGETVADLKAENAVRGHRFSTGERR